MKMEADMLFRMWHDCQLWTRASLSVRRRMPPVDKPGGAADERKEEGDGLECDVYETVAWSESLAR